MSLVFAAKFNHQFHFVQLKVKLKKWSCAFQLNINFYNDRILDQPVNVQKKEAGCG